MSQYCSSLQEENQTIKQHVKINFNLDHLVGREGILYAHGRETSILRLRKSFLKVLLFPLASYAQLNFLLCTESKPGLTFQFASAVDRLH
jgi:hypothetical protein